MMGDSVSPVDADPMGGRYRTREAKVVKNVMAGAQVCLKPVSSYEAEPDCWHDKIVLSTCHGAGSRQLNNMNFDVCIIDEVRGPDRYFVS